MKKSETTNVVVNRTSIGIPMGQYKMTYAACKRGSGKTTTKTYRGFSVFVKNKGDFKKDGMPESTLELFKVAKPIVTFDFKNKSSINTLIEMLEYFRDNEYGKTTEQLCELKTKEWRDG